MSAAYFRIGEVSRRTGLNADVIRAWERRYGMLEPARSEKNFRLYSADDVARLRLMRHYTEQNIAPSRAAQLVREALTSEPSSSQAIPAGEVRRSLTILRESLERFDELPADRLLRRLVGVFSIGLVLRDVVLPYMRELGERWECGEASIAQEHFVSCFLESWMLAIGRGRPRRGDRRAVLACIPDEHHALGLAAFGVVMRELGWSVTYLGRDTPLAAVAAAAEQTSPDVIVLAALLPEGLLAVADALAEFAEARPVVLGGTAAAVHAPVQLARRVLPVDIVAAAQALTRRVQVSAPTPSSSSSSARLRSSPPT